MRAFVCGIGAALVGATFTAAAGAATVTQPGKPSPGEPGFGDIFSSVYGGTFAKDGTGYSNGAVSATLLEDDETFSFDSFSAEVVAGWAAYRQSFGVVTDGGYTNLFDMTGRGYKVGGHAHDVQVDGDFQFARNGSLGILASSKASDNVDNFDHLIAYKLSGEGMDDKYVLFFEDRPRWRSDLDFQDLVVEITAGGQGGGTVPTPAAAALGLGMLGFGVMRRRGA